VFSKITEKGGGSVLVALSVLGVLSKIIQRYYTCAHLDIHGLQAWYSKALIERYGMRKTPIIFNKRLP
jgi:hypothetical protein